ncbi:Neutral/alkaline nonlysosomal ceramidase [Ceraceosorus guamensis]|uniref:Neutral ceramidase n=1 Tax=Ceraceosorus guamensis TaxID=1522189 RepID=A0A316W2K9_9BASI|nr:Neutral/alkaline nonlysosomal ceramidase [Ceraceosorus guamensis]PWN44106.1 Neutral/alkaline nonlysosomal ceramidase [Ceraceosorus guamensis]
MMGYASSSQTNTGLAYRQYSRAFVLGNVGDDDSIAFRTGSVYTTTHDLLRRVRRALFAWGLFAHPSAGEQDPNDGKKQRWVIVNSDLCMGDTGIRRAVVEKLREVLPDVYGERNFAWTGTHSHSGAGGFINALIVQTSSLGIVQQNFDAIVEGTVRSILLAHDDYEKRVARTMVLSRDLVSANAHHSDTSTWPSIRFGNTTLRNAHINRSASAYLRNPLEERQLYDSDTDDEFALLEFVDASVKEVAGNTGVLSVYAVHGTSLYENNTLTSGDNKGLAALQLEFDPTLASRQGSFIAGIAQGSVGDTTPNTGGAYCDATGELCDFESSTCPNKRGKERSQSCRGRPPTWGDLDLLNESMTGGWDWSGNQVIAGLQRDSAMNILGLHSSHDHGRQIRSHAEAKSLELKDNPISGEVRSVKWNVALGGADGFSFVLPNGTRVRTCPAALGYGFAGGTTDGPGPFDFTQGTNDTMPTNPLWAAIRTLVMRPGKEQVACQSPKRILLNIGEQHAPYDWGPSAGIVEAQILRAGRVFILVVPGEFTTMAGRRIKDRVRDSIRVLGIEDEPIVLLTGPANTYGHYVTTIEEYAAQRYEGGSTLFGPHTLEAYIHIYANVLVPALTNDDAAGMIPPGELAPSNIGRAFKMGEKRVVYDAAPFGKSIGDVTVQPEAQYELSSRPSITARFAGANPRNDLRTEGTFLEVQQQLGASWRTHRTDAHPSTIFRWKRTNSVRGSSSVEIVWKPDQTDALGVYRLVYRGNAKQPFTGKIREVEGITDEFRLV